MFYDLTKGITPIDIRDMKEHRLIAGYLGLSELTGYRDVLKFPDTLIDACMNVQDQFRSSVEAHDVYTFTELRIADLADENAKQDCVALYVTKNMLLVIDVEDRDGSTRDKFIRAARRYPAETVTLEKLIYAFFDALVASDNRCIEDMGNRLTELEEDVFHDKANADFNLTLLHLKKRLLLLHNYYEQILDITEVLEENENNILNEDKLIYISNLSGKVTRLREDIDTLRSGVVHLQESYSAFNDAKMNKSMKLLTVITTIFFPLTIIVGWYGMNFVHMPEFRWRYGYVYVIALSVTVIAVFSLIAKRKKWF